jgi:hypothetical protein
MFSLKDVALNVILTTIWGIQKNGVGANIRTKK